ncbi:MAG: hypothetical protein U0X91_03360 [Spirosomataceae bacterium]
MKAPYLTDISKVVKAGKNKPEVRVINQGDNRLVGDGKLPKDKKFPESSGGIQLDASLN